MSGFDRLRSMLLVGSKRAVSLSQLWLTNHGLQMAGMCRLVQPILWSTSLISGIMARILASLFRRTRSECSKLFGIKHCHIWPPYHRTLTLESTNIRESDITFRADFGAQQSFLYWNRNIPRRPVKFVCSKQDCASTEETSRWACFELVSLALLRHELSVWQNHLDVSAGPGEPHGLDVLLQLVETIPPFELLLL